MGSIFQKVRDWWDAADRTQRVVSVVGVALFAAVVAVTVIMASAPTMQPVAIGATEVEKQGMLDELQKKGYRVEVNQAGNVVVPEKDVARAKMTLAGAGKLPRGGSSGFSTTVGAFDTPNVEKQKLLAMLENELSESINTLDGVQSSRVHIAPGRESAVVDEKVNPTATVNIMESQPGKLGKVEGKSIANLIQGAVTGLDSKGVKVVLSSGKTLYDGAEQESDSAIANTKLEAERAQSKTRTEALQRELDMAFGKGNTIADVQVTLNMDPTEVVTHQETPSETPARIDTGVEKLNASTATPTGVGGLDANIPQNGANTTSVGTNGQKYDSNVKSATYAVSVVNKKETKARGDIAGITYSVLANKGAVKDIPALKKLVEGKLGDKFGEPGFTATVVETEFSQEQAKATEKMVAENASAQRTAQIIQALPAVALIVAGFMVVRALGKHLGSVTGQVTAPSLAIEGGGALPGNMVQIGPDGVRMSAESANALQALEGESTPEEVQAKEAAEEAMRETERTAQVMAALGIDEEDSSVDVSAIKAKINVPLEQIKKMAKKRPEIVAMLLKSWLMEEGPSLR
ncbi:MAG: hypothetical protein KF857_05655 [Fimbriimonadaceae bacterium]|nr:hypothetical protein [Fimbriimonadaceae bacterium]